MAAEKLGVEWTPIQGLCRGIRWSLVTVAGLALPLSLLAAYAPYFLLNFWLRWALAFLIGWLLFAVVHRAAGMAGTGCTAIVLIAAAALFLSQHFIFAACGVPMMNGRVLTGGLWFEPVTIVQTNVSVFLGLVFAAMFCHEGGSAWQSILGAFGSRV